MHSPASQSLVSASAGNSLSIKPASNGTDSKSIIIRDCTGKLPKRILLAKLYVEMDLPDKARETAIVVQTKEPKVQSQTVKEMREEMKKIINNE